MCRSRRELSNAYLLAKFGFDTAENEPSKVCRIPWRQRPVVGRLGGGDAALVRVLLVHADLGCKEGNVRILKGNTFLTSRGGLALSRIEADFRNQMLLEIHNIFDKL